MRSMNADDIEQGSIEELRITHSHYVADSEKLRTSAVRSITSSLDLLHLGLHALRSGSTSVTDEYLERSIAALTDTLHQLKG